MSHSERRLEYRDNTASLASPLRAFLVLPNGNEILLKIVNYHHRGACFQLKTEKDWVLPKNFFLKILLGDREIKRKITFRVVWSTIEENGLFGVEFTGKTSESLERAYRYSSHNFVRPSVTVKDPMYPNRIIFFEVQNLSKTGFLLKTSLANKHIFPGMDLKNATLEIAGHGKAKVDLFVENSKAIKETQSVHYGVSFQQLSPVLNELLTRYISNLATSEEDFDRIDTIKNEGILNKKLNEHLTIRIVNNKKDYDEVLKLRFQGYSSVGKISEKSSYKDMGLGLEKEGYVLGAYLSGQLVASCEFRLSRFHSISMEEKVDLSNLDSLDKNNYSEINKLVVHPKAKGTDVVLGILQKIHAIATINDNPDGLILSEPKLIKFYEKIGFKKVNTFLQHPHIDGLMLQLMIVKGQSYADSSGMNPYVWSQAFELNHIFFNHIGMQKRVQFGLKQKIVKYLSFLYAQYLGGRKRKKEKAGIEKQTDNPKAVNLDRDTSDPRWTKQHINATVLRPYILEAEDMVGKKTLSKIITKYQLDRDYFKRESNWVSVEFFDSFLTDFSEFSDTYELNRRAGYRATTKEILGANYFVIKHFFSPKIAFKTFERYFPKFNKTRSYKVIESGRNFCRIRITNPNKELIPKSRSAKENWTALLDSYVRILTRRPAQIQILKSTFDGDEYCEYMVRWKTPFFRNKFVLSFILGFISLYYASYLIDRWEELGVYLGMGLLSAMLYFLIYSSKRSSERYDDIITSMDKLEKSADLKYRELQASKEIVELNYQESRLLDNINRKIQTLDDLNGILQTALKNTCNHFGFERAFIMIADEDSKILKTASVYGANQPIMDLWRFQVDISQKRDNPNFLSSVFHTGQSVIINDLEEHLFHLNEKSKKLIKSLNVNAFCLVPIPSEKKSWGVIVADKGKSKDNILKRDLVSLRRISQSIGLALDKKSKIDSEMKARKIFQKFVPGWVVEETLKNKEPELGGKTRNAICVFADIRNFTSLASTIPSELLIEVLNRLFSDLQDSVTENGGVIDKFLGDGALLTWGVYPWSPMDTKNVFDAIFSFNQKLVEINNEYKIEGFGNLEVGFGIHKGPVIAGNIGSNDRMEFTVIGTTVNLASRLEQITKKFSTTIVVSDKVVNLEDLDHNWTIKQQVQIRGISDLQNIAIYKPRKKNG